MYFVNLYNVDPMYLLQTFCYVSRHMYIHATLQVMEGTQNAGE
jgi:hypothetical protein